MVSPASASSVSLGLACGSIGAIDTDLLVVPAFDGEAFADALPEIDRAAGGEIRRAQTSGELAARPFEFFVTPLSAAGEWKARRVAVAGAGRASDFDTDRLRKLAAAAG